MCECVYLIQSGVFSWGVIVHERIDVHEVVPHPVQLGWNGLCKAAYQGQTAVLQALISRGIKLNTVTKAGQSALYLAALAGHGSAVDALLAAGADVSVRDLSVPVVLSE